jgi:hypothetical protein
MRIPFWKPKLSSRLNLRGVEEMIERDAKDFGERGEFIGAGHAFAAGPMGE